MVRTDVIGAESETFDVRIEFGKIREFARAVQSEHPAHLAAEEPVAPPTFLTTATFFWQDPQRNVSSLLEADPGRSMHASQEFVFHGPPPRAGSRLVGSTRIADVYEKQGRRGGSMTFFVLTTEFRDADGVVVAESTTTGVETAAAVNPES